VEAATVAEALAMRDDTYVTLQGSIVRSIGKERYTFRDSTGEITLEIDNRVWAGRTVTPEMRGEVRGEVEKDLFDPTEIDVGTLTVLD
jgi:uncharacterized protein (TIGR00156 family)